jgi:hypothetical protein
MKMTKTNLRTKIFVWANTLTCFCLAMSGCAPTKGYSGPELPESQTSFVSYQYETSQVSISSSAIDGISFGYSGITVLPGEHLYGFDLILKDPPRWCREFPQFDEYGLRQCRKKAKKNCNCYDYLTVNQKCLRTLHRASCRGEGATEAGRKYKVQFSKYGTNALASVVDLYAGQVGDLVCSTSDSYEEEEESSLGSGREVAYRYGFSGYCY